MNYSYDDVKLIPMYYEKRDTESPKINNIDDLKNPKIRKKFSNIITNLKRPIITYSLTDLEIELNKYNSSINEVEYDELPELEQEWLDYDDDTHVTIIAHELDKKTPKDVFIHGNEASFYVAKASQVVEHYFGNKGNTISYSLLTQEQSYNHFPFSFGFANRHGEIFLKKVSIDLFDYFLYHREGITSDVKRQCTLNSMISVMLGQEICEIHLDFRGITGSYKQELSAEHYSQILLRDNGISHEEYMLFHDIRGNKGSNDFSDIICRQNGLIEISKYQTKKRIEELNSEVKTIFT